jgi:hypothetical protein
MESIAETLSYITSLLFFLHDVERNITDREIEAQGGLLNVKNLGSKHRCVFLP